MTTPPPTVQGQNASGYPVAPQPTSKKKAVLGGLGARIVGGIIVFAVISGGYWAYDQMSGGADTAKVGDCVQNSGTDSSPDVSVVKCTDANAKYKVLKVVDGTDDSKCSGSGATMAYVQSGGRGTSDVVLCLTDNK
ncbi:LppU/SCO3897 family protein [Streptacidiphilus rugosus]|uniref:LppU/SCO3897 family protein n=1 Tax=Streptacidiphilus rugosus TaxID=405783 RepID=UPI000689D1CF|nr:hypothetical protein [Streptacidiphilus rugosus]